MHATRDIQQAPLTLGRSLWAIRPDALPRLIEAHRAPARVLDALAVRPAAATPRAALRRAQTQNPGGAVAVIPLTGVITPRYSFLSFLFGGGGGLVDFRATFREAINNPDVGAIVLDVDSPGGIIDLVPETAQEILDARGTKPIVAVANTTAASAAYWIAAQADEFVVTPSGDVGSVGVYMVHEDWSGWNEKQGVQPTYIYAGDYKTEGNPDSPLSDEARGDWQQEVDDLYGMFVDAVAAGRDVPAQTVRDTYGKGRVLLADRALQAGMVDRVATIEEVIGGLLVPGTGRSATAVGIGRAARIEAFGAAPGENPEAGPCEELEPDETLPPENGPTDTPPEVPDLIPDDDADDDGDELNDPDPDHDGDNDAVVADPSAAAAMAAVLL